MKRTYFLITLFSFVLLTTIGAQASTCAQYKNKIHWQSSLYFEQGEEMYCHELIWPYVFSTGQNSNLVVTDFSDPDHPVNATNFDLPKTCTSLQHHSSTLLIGGHDGLMMAMDVSNPLQPVFRDSIHTGQYHNNIYLAGDNAWVNSYRENVSIVDFSQPDNLTVLGTLPFETAIYDMIECGSLAYIGTFEDWNIFDFSDPSSPELIVQLPDPALSFALDEQTLLVGRQNEIATYDVSDPSAPVLLNTLETEYEVHDLVIHNGLVSALQPGVEKADLFWMLEDGSLEWVTDYSGWYLFADVFLTDEHIIFCNDQNINLINLSDLDTVPGGDHIDTPGVVTNMEINGDFGFFPMGSHGLIVYDFEDPQTPVLAGSAFTPHSVNSIVLRDNLAYLAGHDGLSVLDVTDPTLPYLVGATDNVNSYDTLDITLEQDTIWLAEELRSVSSVDISDPAHPQPGIILPFRAMAVEAKNGLLHTISGDGVYRILSLSTSPPVEIANIQLTRGGSSIEVKDNLVLVGHYWYGLSFLDISDPQNPVLINHIEVMGGARDITVKENHAVVSNYRLTHILDISDPLNVEKVGTIWDGGINHTVLAGGEIVVHHFRGYIYSLQVYPSPCGILTPVHDVPLATRSPLSIHPNPFNPQTTISFDLPAPSAVTVRIYDVTGRLVTTLASGEVTASGMQSWTWMGRDAQEQDVSSGVYLVRLEAGPFQTSGRMVLIR